MFFHLFFCQARRQYFAGPSVRDKSIRNILLIDFIMSILFIIFIIMEIKIYGLVDPRDNNIRYIGKTKRQLNKRLYEHISNKRTIRTYKSNWITALKKENLKPLIIELEVCNENNWVEKEQYWINKTNNLTNLTKGGEDGSFIFTEESIKQMSEQAKKR
jgi:hypothetical protein